MLSFVLIQFSQHVALFGLKRTQVFSH